MATLRTVHAKEVSEKLAIMEDKGLTAGVADDVNKKGVWSEEGGWKEAEEILVSVIFNLHFLH
jgi:hypothetical protein